MKLKTFFVTVLMAFTFSTTYAQFGKIPVEATNAFQAKYPGAKNVAWKSRLASYKADFDLNGQHYTSEFNSKGIWQKTEAKINYTKLPGEVSDGFHKSLYAAWEFTEIVQVDEKDKELIYRIRVKKNELSKKYLFYNTKGQLQKESLTI